MTTVKLIKSAEQIELQGDEVGFDTETSPLPEYVNVPKNLQADPRLSKLRMAQISTGDTTYVMTKNFESLTPLLEDKRVKKYIHTSTFDYKVMLHETGARVKNIVDVAIYEALVRAGRQLGERYTLEAMSQKYLNRRLNKSIRDRFIRGDKIDKEMIEYSADDAEVLIPIFRAQKRLAYEGIDRVARLEFALAPVIAEMEYVGVGVSREKWMSLYEENTKRLKELEQSLGEYDNDTLRQRTMFGSTVLAVRWTPAKKKKLLLKSGIHLEKVDHYTLEAEFEKTGHLLVKHLLDMAKYQKSVSTYGADFLTENVHPITHRVHQRINQVRARTGRLAGSNPNLMNIPKEADVRACFVARIGWRLIAKDYKSQEYVILAQASGDKKLIEAFSRGLDIHLYTARMMWKDKTIEKEDERRRAAKSINFGLVFGMGEEKLANALRIPVSEAKELLLLHRHTFPRSSEYLKELEQFAIAHGYIETLLGRRRYLPGDMFGIERKARNTPIQGTAADMIKIALVYIDRELKRQFPGDAFLVNVVHDEILAECKHSVDSYASKVMTECMVKAAAVLCPDVPMGIDSHVSPYWMKG